jgi:hypothetical protein
MVPNFYAFSMYFNDIISFVRRLMSKNATEMQQIVLILFFHI